MADARLKKTAKILVDYSTKVKKEDKVQIRTQPEGYPLALEVFKLCLLRGAYPSIKADVPGTEFLFYKHAKRNQLEKFPADEMHEIKKTNAVITIGAEYNTREFSTIDPKIIAARSRTLEPLSNWRVEHTRWVLFDYPTNALAQDAGMSLYELENFVFNATNQNWHLLSRKLKNIARKVNASKNARIVAKDTELEFSIRGTHCVVGDGIFNMPDGEVYTAPVKESVNGYITFDFPAVYSGNVVEGIFLEFKNGKVVKAKAEKNEKFLRGMISTDKGSKFLGEFGIGCNYRIKRFTKNILFDEKIGGTIHLALGYGYKECKSKNTSAIHWDMIKDLRKNGAIYLDGKLFQKKGRFVI